MLIGLVEHNATPALLTLLAELNKKNSATWGILAVDRTGLKNVKNEELLLALKPALQNTQQATLFFAGATRLYIAWSGMLRDTLKKLKDTLNNVMLRAPGAVPDAFMSYYDPVVRGDELAILLKAGLQPPAPAALLPADAGAPTRAENFESSIADEGDFTLNVVQALEYKKKQEIKKFRKQLHVLIVEDNAFLSRLLSEVLREDNIIQCTPSAEEGWTLFLAMAPDIVFLDIGLAAADGHVLAEKIKALDPGAHIIMVTSSNHREDVEMARKNNVDGFIVKPFNKKRIDACVQHYLEACRPPLATGRAT